MCAVLWRSKVIVSRAGLTGFKHGSQRGQGILTTMNDADQIKAEADNAFRAGDLTKARDLYLSALDAKPRWAAVHNNLAMVLRQGGDQAGAEGQFRAALAVDPDLIGALSNLGALLTETGNAEEARSVLEHARALAPENPGVLYNWASAAMALQEYEAAVQALEKSIAANPAFGQAYVNLGLCYRSLGNLGAAKDSYQRAHEVDGSLTETSINLAAALADLGDVEGAISAGQEAIRLNPDAPEAHYNLGNAYNAVPDFERALSHYEKALTFKPDHSEATINRARSLWSLGRVDEAYDSMRRTLELDTNYSAAHSNLIFKAQYDPTQSPGMLYAEARRWSDQYASEVPHAYPQPANDQASRPLRVGYLSPHLTSHPVGYFLEPVLTHHDPKQVEAICYSDTRKDDPQVAKLKASGVSWVNVLRDTDDTLAQRIRDDRIDILIDLDGHSGPNRLPVFAHRAAPLQATWAGYVGTTGLDAMDYLITDHRQTVEQDLGLMTEQPVYMPGNYVTLAPMDDAPAVGPSPSDVKGHVTFGCFNNLDKINAQVIAAWAEVMNAVPGSRLLLIAFDLGDTNVRTRIASTFASHGISALRLDFRGKCPRAELLAAYNDIDIALDTFPYSGGLTTLEALWMGVPVVTKADGDRFASRHSVTHLTAVGLLECVADDAADYVARAVALAANASRRSVLRETLRDQMRTSPACDGAAFTQALERAYRIMWQRLCAGDPKSPIEEAALRGA